MVATLYVWHYAVMRVQPFNVVVRPATFPSSVKHRTAKSERIERDASSESQTIEATNTRGEVRSNTRGHASSSRRLGLSRRTQAKKLTRDTN